ncbi:MAG: hypothetical protein KME64_41270 [Scytonematopsis contorta HA4267-MV1]|nr:hypothetical protein [Scytonematopsis contorta HA4267-MV1]
MDEFVFFEKKKRLVICKLILFALMWTQVSEDLQATPNPNFSSKVEVENDAWLEHSFPELPIFKQVSNSVRIGAWLDVLLSKLASLAKEFPTCLHDACWSGLVHMLMKAVEEELKGSYIYPQVPTFARSLALNCVEDVAPNDARWGDYQDFQMTIEEAKSLLPVDRKAELEIDLDQYILENIEKDYVLRGEPRPKVEELTLGYLREVFLDYFNEANWRFDINQEVLKKLQDKYGPEQAEGAYSAETQEVERWAVSLGYFEQFLGFNFSFIYEESDINVDSDFVPDDEYWVIKPYIQKYKDRSDNYPRLVHILIYFILSGEYNYKVEKIMDIPVFSRSASSLQGLMLLAAYRSGLYMAANNVPEYEKGSSWLFANFPDLQQFYKNGRLAEISTQAN